MCNLKLAYCAGRLHVVAADIEFMTAKTLSGPMLKMLWTIRQIYCDIQTTSTTLFCYIYYTMQQVRPLKKPSFQGWIHSDDAMEEVLNQSIADLLCKTLHLGFYGMTWTETKLMKMLGFKGFLLLEMRAQHFTRGCHWLLDWWPAKAWPYSLAIAIIAVSKIGVILYFMTQVHYPNVKAS